MSKTDQMRALREARFTRSSFAAPRRVPPTPAAAPPPRSSRSAAAVERSAPTAEILPEAVAAELVVAAPSFEVSTLDIAVPAPVPRVREAPIPVPTAKFSEVPQAPVPEQIVIPALDLTDTGPHDEADVTAAGEAIEPPEAREAPASLGHGVIPGQPIAAYSQEDLVAVVRWVGRDARPRDAAAMVRDVMVELGFKRRGAKITDAVTTAATSIGALADEPKADAPTVGAIAS